MKLILIVDLAVGTSFVRTIGTESVQTFALKDATASVVMRGTITALAYPLTNAKPVRIKLYRCCMVSFDFFKQKTVLDYSKCSPTVDRDVVTDTAQMISVEFALHFALKDASAWQDMLETMLVNAFLSPSVLVIIQILLSS